MKLRIGLAGRLFMAQLLTIAVGAATLVIVAILVGPPLLNAHLDQVLGPESADIRQHVEEGYSNAAAITIAVAGIVSLAAAIAVSMLVTRRLVRPISQVSQAATRLAVGDYQTRVPAAGLGVEMDNLTTAFNTMADSLEGTELTRQRLLGDVAHELRTPLATIRAYHEALADGIRQPDEKAWSVLISQTDRIQRLIDDIALISRAEEQALTLHLENTNVNDLIAVTVAAAESSFTSKGVSLHVGIPPDLPSLLIDADRIGQVLTNLLTNALRHTPSGGQVTLAAIHQNRGTNVATNRVIISVADNGDGINSDELPHIFERFYRIDNGRDRGHGGSGIGLTIARALTQAHGGTLTATSDGVGYGSTFTVALPSGWTGVPM